VDTIFKAIADPTRRQLLDRLFERDGQKLGELCEGLGISRQATSKHLRTLEEAALVAVRWSGRSKLHFLNVMPIRALHDRWIDKYRAPWVDVLQGLKHTLEGPPMESPRRLYQTWIRTSAESLWQAITDPAFTRRYFFGSEIHSTFEVGAPVTYTGSEGGLNVEGTIIESERPRRLVMTWRSLWTEELAADPPSTVTWEIEELGEVCRLTLLHTFDSENATYHETEGWALILAGLKTLIETGNAMPMPLETK
jgi:DNA-binding transcriptional ArsR family regulator/uncharacterized protein YndB with AHSA1/START domain